MAYSFPTLLPEPVVPYASNSGDTYSYKMNDSTISTTTDANYEVTRPRTTRIIHTFVYTWTRLTDAEFQTLADFWAAVRTSEAFSFLNYSDGKNYTVRFATGTTFDFKYDYPNGWSGSLTFKEV